jgi:hypothetical protein
MLWFWIMLGCVAVVAFAVLERRAQKKPEKLHPWTSGDESVKWPHGPG